jgi:DNA-binding PadR family transcriptional regulator
MGRTFLGEFEQHLLLAILRCEDQATALAVRRELDRVAGREVSRGAFYTTLERLERKGLVDWKAESGGAERGGLPIRRFRVTGAGVRELRAARKTLLAMWRGLEWKLDKH